MFIPLNLGAVLTGRWLKLFYFLQATFKATFTVWYVYNLLHVAALWPDVVRRLLMSKVIVQKTYEIQSI